MPRRFNTSPRCQSGDTARERIPLAMPHCDEAAAKTQTRRRRRIAARPAAAATSTSVFGSGTAVTVTRLPRRQDRRSRNLTTCTPAHSVFSIFRLIPRFECLQSADKFLRGPGRKDSSAFLGVVEPSCLVLLNEPNGILPAQCIYQRVKAPAS